MPTHSDTTFEEVQWSLAPTIYGAVTQSLSKEFSAGQHDGYSATIDCGAPTPYTFFHATLPRGAAS